MYTDIVPMFLLLECILNIFFFAVPFTAKQDMTIKKILEKTKLQRSLVRYAHKNCTIVLFNSIYLVLVYNFFVRFHSIEAEICASQKISKMIAAPSVEWFSPKVDRH